MRGVSPRGLLHVGALLVVWALASLAAGLWLFLGSSRTVVVASHDTVVRPTLDGTAVMRTGPVLPDLRIDSGRRLGVEMALGKTEAQTTEELVQRYGFIASQPEAQIAKVEAAVRDMAISAAARGALVGLAPVAVWILLGHARRHELARRLVSRRGLAGLACVGALAALAIRPASDTDAILADQAEWTSLADFVGPGVVLPAEVAGVEVRTDVTTSQSRRLILSAVSTYQISKEWYADAATAAEDLALRRPREDETVAVLVSDRHDNVGMDQVARAIGDAAGATAILDAGDDTSTGRPWEAFSLDSLDERFSDYDRWAIAGNHDHGSFVSDYLRERGWTNPDGEVVDGPGDSVLLGVDDPRSSGLGNWRDETGLSFDEVADRIAEAACGSESRIGTLLVHDTDLGTPALDRGCVDLVVGGHTHVQEGPVRVVGEDGLIGYRYTTGTAGGAAYAIAVGSKPRRPAEVSLITYRDGRPVGVQAVLLQTNGTFVVEEYVELDYEPEGRSRAQQPREKSAPR